jgi:hypothetical protein
MTAPHCQQIASRSHDSHSIHFRYAISISHHRQFDLPSVTGKSMRRVSSSSSIGQFILLWFPDQVLDNGLIFLNQDILPRNDVTEFQD